MSNNKRFKFYNHLGFHNPYFVYNNDKIVLYEKIGDILKESKSSYIDNVSLLQILSTGYVFGDRTLVSGIQKTPWMAKPSSNMLKWEYYDVPKHEENKNISIKEIAKTFYSLLKEELLEYIENHSTIGVLLTGGMDSRIVACVLNEIILSGEAVDKKIVAFTWGNLNSRDVVYAKRISEMFKWDWIHLPVDVEQMYTNIDLCVDLGCEFSPIHLHSMSKLKNYDEIDCVLAGSFGDSVGRAEYSGVRVENLKCLTTLIKDPSNLLNINKKKALLETKSDVDNYHNIFFNKKKYMLYEQDQELHYMRRMLNACMSIINRKVPLYQMFSSPKVFGYIWSLHPVLRTDDVYKHILEIKNKKLLEIPWARTGLIYPNKKGERDGFSKNHHDYGKMIREDMLLELDFMMKDSPIFEFNIVNEKSFKSMVKLCKIKPISGSYYFEDKILFFSALHKFIKKNNILIHNENRTKIFTKDSVYFHYFVRYFGKKILASI